MTQEATSLINGLKAQILTLIDEEKFDEAYALVEPHLETFKTEFNGCYLIGLIQNTRQERTDAIQWFKRCVHFAPDHPEANYHLGVALNDENYQQAAIPFLNRVVKLQPTNAKAWMALASSLHARDRAEMAIAAYQNAYQLDPDLPDLKSKMATCYLNAGEAEAAKKWSEQAMEEEPNNPSLFYNYVIIHNGKVEDALLKRFETQYQDSPKDSSVRGGLAFGLANVYEKRKDLEKACDYYDDANRIKAEHSDYSAEGRDEIFSGIREIVADWPKQDHSAYGIAEEGPIFVVGMPRSGTTLTQQILGAHSKVTGAGELLALRGVVVDGSMKLTQTAFPESIAQLVPEQSIELAKAYLQAIRSFGDTTYIVDKMPANFLHIPFIWRMFPKAKVIHTNREPIDVCWSMWRQSFKSALDYCYDPQWMAEYYAAYLEQMAYYRTVFPDFIYDLSYEALTSNPEEEVRKMISFCGLEWEDSVMDYHKSKQKIRTASVNQANKPIYTSSQRSWEPVKHRLRPLIEALHERGVETCVSRGEVTL